MPANEVIGLSAEMKVQQVLDELRRIGPGADKEAKAIAASLGKSLKDSEKAAKALGDQMKKAGDAGKGGLDRAAKALGPLGGVLSKLDPQLGSVASSIAGLTGAAEGFEAAGLGVTVGGAAAAVGVLAAVLGAGYLAWTAYNDEAARGAEVAAMVATAESKLAPLIDATRLAELDAAVATGQMTEAAAKLEREGIASMKAFASATADANAQIKALHAAEGTPSRMYADFVEAAQGSTILQITSLGTISALAAMTESSSEAQTKIDALMQVETHAAAIVKEGTKAREASVGAVKHHAGATADMTALLLKEAAASQSAADKLGAHLAAIEADATAADAMVAASGDFRLSEIDRLARAEDAAITAYDAKAKAGALSIEDIAAGEATIRGNYQDQITAKQADEAAKRTKAEIDASQKVADAQAASTAKAIGTINQVGGYAQQALSMLDTAATASYQHSADIAQSLTDQLIAGDKYYTTAQKAELTAREAQARATAIKQFNISKGEKIAEALASTALAAINAIAESPPPSPLGLIGAGIATAAGLASVATIASTQPSFHSGYAPDEMSARILRKETVLTPTGSAMLGTDAARDLNAGKSPAAGYSGPAPIVIGHKTMNDLIKRELANSGALTIALSAGQILGHRTNRRGTTG